MGELTIRRDRGVSVPRYQSVGKPEKQAGGGQAQKASGTTGFAVSETLRQLMDRVSQGEGRIRESRQSLRTGEAVLAEVQDSLGRMAELARRAAGDGEADREVLQAELEHLREGVERMMNSAAAGGSPLFLDDGGTDALLYAVLKGAAEGQEVWKDLPDWLVKGMAQGELSPERLLSALGLDRTASGAEVLAALTEGSLDGDGVAGYLATLYLGAVIAGKGSDGTLDPDRAMDGLRQLMEKMAGGVPMDQAVEELTDGAFTGLADFQGQFTGGTAPGLEQFLAGLLLNGEEAPVLAGFSAPALLAGIDGMQLDLLVGLMTVLDSAGTAAEAGASGALAEPGTADAPPQGRSVQVLGNVQVLGRDISGVSLSASGELTIGGAASVIVQGTGPAAGQSAQAILITGSGAVTLQNVNVSTLTIGAAMARVFSQGESLLGQVQLRDGAALTLGGEGLLKIASFRAGSAAALHLTGGAVVLEPDRGSAAPGVLAVPVVLEGPASLAARAETVRNPAGKTLQPFDIVWKTLLPGFDTLTALEVDGRQTRLALTGGGRAAMARLWLEKGDSTHGFPAHSLAFRGQDASGQVRTRYAYLLWNQREGAFQEFSMYPNPFTVTGGEQDQDWVYEEGTCTLRILSGQVTAVSGGAGTDANQDPFSGRIALADGIGAMELTLSGVVCRVSGGSAFDLGRENDVTLLLQSGSRNYFSSGAGCAGISLGEGTSLRIDCGDSSGGREPAGKLTASGGAGGSGIGRDSGAGGDQTSRILICGGIITASGGAGGAGIGAGKGGAIGAITIQGGKVTASSGAGGGAGIGGALGAPAGDIIIQGGTVSAVASRHAAAIGAGIRGESGDILITGTARITRASGGDPGADIGASVLGDCGKVLVSGSADTGSAGLWTRSGVSLKAREDAVILPQFRLSSRTLRLDKLRVSTREYAQTAQMAIEAERRWVFQLQAAYSALYGQLTQSIGVTEDLVRDTAQANTLLEDMRQAISRPASQALYTHSRPGTENVRRLLR